MHSRLLHTHSNLYFFFSFTLLYILFLFSRLVCLSSFFVVAVVAVGIIVDCVFFSFFRFFFFYFVFSSCDLLSQEHVYSNRYLSRNCFFFLLFSVCEFIFSSPHVQAHTKATVFNERFSKTNSIIFFSFENIYYFGSKRWLSVFNVNMWL